MAFLSRDQNAFRECCGSCQGEISSSGLPGSRMHLRAALISEPYQLHQGPSSLEDVVQGAVSVGLDPSIMLYSFLRLLLTLTL